MVDVPKALCAVDELVECHRSPVDLHDCPRPRSAKKGRKALKDTDPDLAANDGCVPAHRHEHVGNHGQNILDPVGSRHPLDVVLFKHGNAGRRVLE